MKRNILLLILSAFFVINAQAQIPPQAFNYSAVARDAQSNPIASQTIGIQISILQTTSIGPVVYSENHFVNTDQYGLFNLIIGAGAIQSGSMGTIDWSGDNYYLKVGMDANGGTNFLTMGTTQLISVPFALHAATADSLIGGGSITETDPIYSTSVASGISAVDTTNWNADIDPDPTNELQTISISNDTIYLSNGGFAVLPVNPNGTTLPVVSTDSLISSNAYQSNFYGTIISTGNELILSKGFVYNTAPTPSVNDNLANENIGGASSSITDDLFAPSEITPNTTYYVRSYATNINGTAYGNEISLTTPNVSAPIITLNSITNIDQVSSTIEYILNNDGNAPITQFYVLVDTNPNPTNGGPNIGNSGYDVGLTYQVNTYNLDYNTTYYVRIYAENILGQSAYSNELSFTTLDCMLTIDSYFLANVNASSFQFNGSFSNYFGCGASWPSGGDYGTVYSTSPNPTLLTANIAPYTGSDFGQAYSLSPGTTYYCRGYVITSQDTLYTADVIITTLSGLATSVIYNSNSVTQTDALIDWEITDDGGEPLWMANLCLSTLPNPTIADITFPFPGPVVGTYFGSYVDGLSPNTTYYVRSAVETQYGTTYSNEISFTTLP